MHILFIAPYAPGHVRVRSFQLLRQLLRRGHEVTLAYPEWHGESQGRVAELETAGARVICAPISRPRSWYNCLVAIVRRQPMQALHAFTPALERRLRAEVARARPDIVHVEHLRAACYASDGTAAGDVARIWDSVDCISSLLEQASVHSHSPLWRLAARLELPSTCRYEARVARAFDRTLVVSEADRRALTTAVAPAPGISVLPNGVDLEAFRYSDPGDRRPEILFSGALAYHANDTAARHLIEAIMPRVWAARPEVRLKIVGPSPSHALRRHAAREPRRLRLTGWVPSMSGALATAAVAAVPMRYGAGIQNKVLEALACGTPVVADPRTAEAIGARHGEELLTADGDPAFADAILVLLAEPALRRRLGEAGRRRVETRFSWEAAADDLERHYGEVLAARGEHPSRRD